MSARKPALLALQDGSLFWGESVGVAGQAVGEVVFNTAITGYQEILTDPSYYKQIVTFTYPHIGNVGVNRADANADKVWATGLVIRDLSLTTSNWRAELSLAEYLQQQRVVAIAGIDTRRLTRILREKGAQNGCIVAGDNINEAEALKAARDFPGLKDMDLAQEVTTSKKYEWRQGSWTLEQGVPAPRAADELPWHVAAYDYGIKRGILRRLADRGCRVTVLPARTPAQEALALRPDGVFLSNGPGDPEPCDYAITAIREILQARVPVFGICLGHQLLGLASGAGTVKMKFGHHGANHPVQELTGGRVLITSQNHGFAVDEATLPKNLRVTHRSLFDGSLQGVERTDCPAFSFQGHPEDCPGPHDVHYLFDKFIDMMKQQGKEKSG